LDGRPPSSAPTNAPRAALASGASYAPARSAIWTAETFEIIGRNKNIRRSDSSYLSTTSCRSARSSQGRAVHPVQVPDWALVARMLWNLDQVPEFRGRTELSEAHRLYDAGDIDAAYEAFKPLLDERRGSAN
jgi:hypothetical protein